MQWLWSTQGLSQFSGVINALLELRKTEGAYVYCVGALFWAPSRNEHKIIFFQADLEIIRYNKT